MTALTPGSYVDDERRGDTSGRRRRGTGLTGEGETRRAAPPRVYDSLRTQTFRDFEWLVADDGSTDGTGALVEAWRAEADFPIRYRYQGNRGKHVAWNRAVPEARRSSRSTKWAAAIESRWHLRRTLRDTWCKAIRTGQILAPAKRSIVP